jgi:hypothetical protein
MEGEIEVMRFEPTEFQMSDFQSYVLDVMEPSGARQNGIALVIKSTSQLYFFPTFKLMK